MKRFFQFAAFAAIFSMAWAYPQPEVEAAIEDGYDEFDIEDIPMPKIPADNNGMIALFVEGKDSGGEGNETWTDSTCAVSVQAPGGWHGTFGPWHGSCNDIADLPSGERWLAEANGKSEQKTMLITPSEKLLLFEDLLTNETFKCQLNGLAPGHGCAGDWSREMMSDVQLEEKRDIQARGDITEPGCNTRKHTHKVKHPNLKHFWKHRKLSTNVYCRKSHVGSSCGVGQSQSKSYAEGYTVNFAIPDFWINGGYSVTKTVTTGNDYHCNVKPGGTVCIWKITPFLAYNAKSRTVKYCWNNYGQRTSHHVTHSFSRIRSPKINAAGHVCRFQKKGCHQVQGHYFWTKQFRKPHS